MLDKLRNSITRYELFQAGHTLVVGVSGGPDSTALLHALAQLRAEYCLQLVAAHYHHGFRGEEADADAVYVRELAEMLDVPFRMEKADVPAMRRRRHLSAQEAAREARHAYLRRVAAEVGAERIALAHTRDDRIETVLLNLLRGSGLEGLQGFPPASLPLIRPLYDLRRAEIEAYCQAQNLQPRLDSSNVSLDYRRNRIRAELLPYLRTYFNEEVDDAITRMSDLAVADNEVLEGLTTEALEQNPGPVLNAAQLNALPVALRRRVLRQAIGAVRGHLQNIGFETLERIVTALADGQRLTFDLPGVDGDTIRVRCLSETVEIVREVAPSEPLPWQVILNVPGETELPTGEIIEAVVTRVSGVGCRLSEEPTNDQRSATNPGKGKREKGKVEPLPEAESENTTPDTRHPTPGTLCFSLDDVQLPLLVRNWRPGDRMSWRGLSGTKKLQDLFTDAKIPVALRHRLPVLVENGGEGRILAVIGLRADTKALTKEECRNAKTKLLLLTFRTFHRASI
jgi:tRNA(Ile)-lysidine synthase